MIKLNATRFYETAQENLADGVSLSEEGQAMQYFKIDGKTVVAPSDGTGKNFAGISVIRNAPPGTVPVVEESTVDAGGPMTLMRKPRGGVALVSIAGTALTPVSAAPADGEYWIQNDTITFNVAQDGQDFLAQYTYEPSVTEARTITGDMPYGGFAANLMGTVTTAKRGIVSTSFYKADADWTTVVYVKLGAGGVFIPGTDNDHVPNIRVKNTPSSGAPFLELDINIA